ncbi:hypothetical protein [Halomicrobium sp. ZPS1]|uniref:hypothetical protein n=1 Tax=Halomicrobium sp. ZPS1 TaxID=2790029 RepID=UPI00186B545D|nr:hypothetical protein [Halomicrobium sp. ZPS1]
MRPSAGSEKPPKATVAQSDGSAIEATERPGDDRDEEEARDQEDAIERRSVREADSDGTEQHERDDQQCDVQADDEPKLRIGRFEREGGGRAWGGVGHTIRLLARQ